jgi:6-pyruvoyltetrahydropterin/6-carboxytetrahydropterin synthase
MLEFLERMNSKKVIVDFQSTAENICTYFLNEIKKSNLPSNVQSIKVRVYETAYEYAEDSFRLK